MIALVARDETKQEGPLIGSDGQPYVAPEDRTAAEAKAEIEALRAKHKEAMYWSENKYRIIATEREEFAARMLAAESAIAESRAEVERLTRLREEEYAIGHALVAACTRKAAEELVGSHDIIDGLHHELVLARKAARKAGEDMRERTVALCDRHMDALSDAQDNGASEHRNLPNLEINAIRILREHIAALPLPGDGEVGR